MPVNATALCLDAFRSRMMLRRPSDAPEIEKVAGEGVPLRIIRAHVPPGHVLEVGHLVRLLIPGNEAAEDRVAAFVAGHRRRRIPFSEVVLGTALETHKGEDVVPARRDRLSARPRVHSLLSLVHLSSFEFSVPVSP